MHVVDRGYLKIQKKWRRYVAQSLKCPLVQIESDVVVPVQTESPKEEYTAATFRPKIQKKLDFLLHPLNDACMYIYTLEELEKAETHGPYWNAAQREMMLRGMHIYMRMYWEKRYLNGVELLRKPTRQRSISTISMNWTVETQTDSLV